MHKLMKCLISSLVLGVLFFALSPGVILTLPPVQDSKGVCKYQGYVVQLSQDKHAGGCATSYFAAGVHAAVFAVLCFFMCWFCCDYMK